FSMAITSGDGDGGGGGDCMLSVVEAEAVSGGLRSSPTLQVTVIVPGSAPRLSSVAVAVLPLMFPALGLWRSVRLRPSGLVAFELMVEVPHMGTLAGSDEHEIMGGRGSFTVNLAVQEATPYSLPSLMLTVTW